MTIKRFEDLEIWQLARELNKVVYKITSQKPFCNDFKFCIQIRSASGSVMDNIAEGFDRGGNKEFIQFLSIALGSTAEIRSQSYRASDAEYIDKEMHDLLLIKTESLSRKTSKLMAHLKNSDIKGLKYS